MRCRRSSTVSADLGYSEIPGDKALTEKIASEVLPFVLGLSMRGQQAAHVHQALRLLRSASCFAVSGLRVRPDRGEQSHMSKALETSYTGVSFSDWKPRAQPWQRSQKPEKSTQREEH